MKESIIRRSLCSNFRKVGRRDIFIRAIEDKASAGTPDVFYCFKGISGWIEIKHIKEEPKKNLFKIAHYTLLQHLWLQQHQYAGGRSWLFIRIKDTCYLLKVEDLKPYIIFVEADSERFSFKDIKEKAIYTATNRKMDYEALLNILIV